MPELDLSKAVNAFRRSMHEQGTDTPVQAVLIAMKTAALPHILDALADEAEAVVKGAEARLDALPLHAGWSERAAFLHRIEYHDYVARHLRGKAGEARRG